jgi:hypothetical protein
MLWHTSAVIAFVCVSWFWASLSWDKGVEHVKTSDTTSIYFQVVMQYRHERATAKPDETDGWRWKELAQQVWKDQRTTFTSTDLGTLYQASFLRYLGTVYRVTGDVTLGYKILVFPLNLVFMLGAYALFFRLTGKHALATTLAVLASLPIAIPLAGEYFGMGPVTIYSRRNLFTAFAPFTIFLFYRWAHRPGLLLLAFAFLGLISNLHSSGILLAAMLVMTYLLSNHWGGHAWLHSLGYSAATAIFGFVAMGGLWAQVSNIAKNLVQAAIPSALAAASGTGLRPEIPETSRYLFYPPHIYAQLPDTLVHAMTFLVIALPFGVIFMRRTMPERLHAPALFVAVMATTAFLAYSELKYYLLVAAVLFILTRRRPPDPAFELTHYFGLAIFYVSFVGMLLFQAGYFFADGFPLVLNQLRGTRFLGFFIFIWLAVLASRITWTDVQPWGRRTLVACAAIAFLMALRHDFRSYIRYKDDPETAALMDLARWSKANTPESARFLVASTSFAVIAERGVLFHDKEYRTSNGQKTRDRMQGGFPALNRLATETGMDYIVARKNLGELPAPVYENSLLALVKPQNGK